MTAPQTDSSEDTLIARYFRPLATHPGAFGLMDDAAVVSPPPGFDLVLKTDAIIGSVHFFPDDPAGAVAQKALRVNLSDLAAKGARPLGCLLSIGMPRGISEPWLAAFSAGLGEDIVRFGCPLFGGDTVRSPDAIMISVAVFGTVPHGTMVKRMGAKPNDRVIVTGTIGDAALGLKLRNDPAAATRWALDKSAHGHLAQRYLVPEPRLAVADALRRFATAAMDVSDGLAGDLHKLCRASGVSADIDVGRVPLSPAARMALAKEPELIEAVLTNGDDYEVLSAVPPDRLEIFQNEAQKAGVSVTDIGAVVAGDRLPRFLLDGRPLNFASRSFSHF